jgi:hypothetical protein
VELQSGQDCLTVLDSRSRNCELYPDCITDGPDKYLLIVSSNADTTEAGLELDVFRAEKALYGGSFWPLIRFHERRLEIEQWKVER